jgi:ferredoxin
MPKVIINDEEFEAAEGELLLDVARRNGVHIGFACNGNGICTTCECKVLSGAAALTPLSDVETDWLPQSRLDAGMRLGCQTSVNTTDNGETLEVITRVEELKRQFAGLFRPAEGERVVDNCVRFVTNIAKTTVDHVLGAPAGMLNAYRRIGLAAIIYPYGEELNKFLDDGRKVIDRELGRNRGTDDGSSSDSDVVKS